ncbi:MAG: tetratricopeptide repeat protein [Candidatus Thioglobus sp.]|jgi:cytochrome c-type biogenesis protein CcmH|nr:tetratricopeptide repeat protein [Candidatus Thioglobus sp.]
MVAWQFILMILLSCFLLVFFLYRPVKITVHDDSNIPINPLSWSVIIVLFIAISSLLFYDHLKPAILLEKSYDIQESVSLSDSIISLESYLKNNPEDSESWKMLGLAKFNLGEFSSSIESFEKAVAINPDDVEMLLQYASVLVAMQDGSFVGKPKSIIEKILKIDPQSIHALYLSGIAAANQSDIIAAKKFWQKALYIMPEKDPDRKVIEEAIKMISE